MPNDAKLGMVVGVGLVIAVAVVFDRKDAPGGSPAAIEKTASAQAVGATPNNDSSMVKATAARRHTVQAGETLSSLARRYLGDESKAATIRELNPTLQGTDDPPVGTVLVLPETQSDSH